MTIGIDANANIAIMTAVLGLIEAGTGAGLVKFYAGTRPSAGAAIGANVLIATCALQRPAGTIDGAGVLNIAMSPTLGTVLVATMPNWARISDSAETFVLDADVRSSSATDIGEEIVIDAATLAAGALLDVVSGYLTAN